MSNIILSYNWPYKTKNNISPTMCYYDGLRIAFQNSGHNIMEINNANFFHGNWSGSNDPVYIGSIMDYESDIINQKVKTFNPDLIIAFNHCITKKMYEITNCPIFIIEGDSPLSNFWFNKDLMLKNLDRVIFSYNAHFHLDFYKKIFKISQAKCHHLKLATSCYKKDVAFKRDICFVGSIHGHCYDNELKNYIQQSKNNDIIKNKLIKIVKEALKNDLYYIKEDLEKDFPKLSFETLFFYIAEIRRKNTLDLLMNDFDLEIFGWTGLDYYDPLYLYFNSDPVYSSEHNSNIYNSSKISISITQPQSNSSIEGYSWRVCDTMATNACFLGSYSKSIELDFGKWVDLPMFNNAYECYSLCKKLLAEENLRKDIVAGSQLAIKEGKFTFYDRVKEIEQIFNLKKSDAKSKISYEFLINNNTANKEINNKKVASGSSYDLDIDNFYKKNSLINIINRVRINLFRKIRKKSSMHIVKK